MYLLLAKLLFYKFKHESNDILPRKTILYLTSIFLFIGTLFYACSRKKEIYPSLPILANNGLSIEMVKKYYYEILVKSQGYNVPQPSSITETRPNYKYPLWSKALISTSPQGNPYVEVPLAFNQKISSNINRPGEKDPMIDSKIFMSSLVRLLIYKDKNTGKFRQFIVRYIPDITYLNAHNGDISQNKMGSLDKDFSGFIKFSQWDGTPLKFISNKQWQINT